MNTETGELTRIMAAKEKEYLQRNFNMLTESEAREADAILGDKQSVILPPDHPLRQRVTRRVGKPATAKQIAQIRKYFTSMGVEAFWAWCKENAPDITPETGLSCGMAQRLLNLLPKTVKEVKYEA